MTQRRVAIVADDHELSQVALKLILEKRLRFESVVCVASLDEALQSLSETPDVDLALLDLDMPGMAGAASMAAVRTCRPDVTVAIVSGSTRSEDILAGLAAGIHGYIPKAMSVDRIGDAIESVLAGRIHVPPELSRAPSKLPLTAQAPPSIEALTPRQRQVLALIAEGKSNKHIARALNLGLGTVKIHVAALLRALNVPNRAAAAVIGARLN